MPWCKYCQLLAPKWEEMATTLSKEEPSIKIAKMDLEKNAKFDAKEYEISSYPTIILFINGEPTHFEGKRKPYLILTFIENSRGWVATIL